MRVALSNAANEHLSAGSCAYGTYPASRKAVPETSLNQGVLFDLGQISTDNIKEQLTKVEGDLMHIATQVLELYNQNKSFLQVLLTNNSQLEIIASSVRNTESLVSHLHNTICKTAPAQPTSRKLSTARSASLPAGSKWYRTSESLSSGINPSLKPDIMVSELLQDLTPKVGDTAPHTVSTSHVGASHSLQPLAVAYSAQRPGSPEQQETAAVLAASAAAQVMAEQRGLEDLDTVFYNKVLTKLLSPQPNIPSGNWDTNMSRRATCIVDVAIDRNERKLSKHPQNVELSPRPPTISNVNSISSSKQGLASTIYPTNSHDSRNISPVVLQELLPASQAVQVESPVGPGATLTFKGGYDTSFQRDKSTNVPLEKAEEYVKIPTLSNSAFHTHCHPTSSTTVPNPALSSEHDQYSSKSELGGTHTVDSASADLGLDNQTPINASPPQSPRLLSDDLQTLIAVAEPHAVILQSDQGLISASTERSKEHEAEKPVSIVRQSSTRKRSGSKCTPRPRSASKPKVKSKSQPTSRSNSRRNSITKQATITLASPSPRSSKPSPSKAQAKPHVKPITISAHPDSRYSTMSQTSLFNASSDIHLGSAGPSSMASMSLSTVGIRPGARQFSRSSSLPLNGTGSRLKSDKTRLNMILEKYSEAPGILPAKEEQKCNSSLDPLEYRKVFSGAIPFMQFFLDHSNCDPFSPLPTDDLLTRYASALCEKMLRVPLDTVGKHLILTAEWMVEQFVSEHLFSYIVTQSFVAEHFVRFPKTLSEVALEISADNRRRKEEYDKLMTEYEIERKKGSPRSKRPEKPEEPRKYTVEQFHTAFKRCLRNLWGPELERELIYYFHERYMDMTATEGIILQEVTDVVENPKKSLFPGHNLYNYADLFNKYEKQLSPSTPNDHPPDGKVDQYVAYNLYFYYCLLSIYLLLNDCLPIRFNIYFMNYKTFQGVFRYISPEDLEKPMNMSSNFRLYWPAWKDVRRGTLRLHCKFVEVRRDEKSSKLY